MQFFGRKSRKFSLNIWKRFKKTKKILKKRFFSRKFFSTRRVHFWELCAKTFSEKTSCCKTGKKEKLKQVVHNKSCLKIKKNSGNSSPPNFFWTLRSSFDKLGASFSAGSAKGFQSESANKTKESFSSRSLLSSKLSSWHKQCCSYRLAPNLSQKLENFLLKIQKRLEKNSIFSQKTFWIGKMHNSQTSP